MNSFYVYALLNLNIPGKFKYNDIELEFLPFYIGKGKGKRDLEHFKNYSLKPNSSKNKFLKEGKCISKKIKDNLSEDDAFRLERYYIDLIGRIDNGAGPLANLTSGGQGVSGYKYTPDQLIKRSKEQSTIGNGFYNKKHKKNTFNKFKRSVYQIDINTGEIIDKFDSLSDAAIKTNSDENHIRDCCNGSRKTHNGFRWEDANSDYVKKRISKGNNTQKRKILKLDLDGKITEYESISYASKVTGIRKCNIIGCLSKNRLSAGGFKWKYSPIKSTTTQPTIPTTPIKEHLITNFQKFNIYLL